MNDAKMLLWALGVSVMYTVLVSNVWGQSGSGRKGRGPMHRGGRHDAQFQVDHDVFHFLLSNHKKIQRTVTNRDDGVETLTESDDAKIAAKIQEHVAAMYKRVEKRRPIRRRDPLFDELFRHAEKIHMKIENTKKGIKVTETSQDPYVVRLIQEHARVVSLFVESGHAEARKNHAIPKFTSEDGKWNGKIVQYGELHQVLAEGKHQGRIKLGDLARHRNCYAVGALAGLAGEITIVDGQIVVSKVTDSGPPISPGKPQDQQATIIVAAHVPKWVEHKIDRDVDVDSFERFVRDTAAVAGLDPTKPFPFVVDGTATGMEMHVINGACPIRASRLGVTLPGNQKPYRGSLKQATVRLVGFYAADSVGDLTCHGANAHTHVVLKTKDGRSYTGHVESVGLKAGAVLRLPEQ